MTVEAWTPERATAEAYIALQDQHRTALDCIEALMAALHEAERALVAKEARDYWNQHASADSTQARAYAESHPTPVIQMIRDALRSASGEAT